jgi:phosphoribosylformylglycinamidine (FGAM) synthase-like enzyme
MASEQQRQPKEMGLEEFQHLWIEHCHNQHVSAKHNKNNDKTTTTTTTTTKLEAGGVTSFKGPGWSYSVNLSKLT